MTLNGKLIVYYLYRESKHEIITNMRCNTNLNFTKQDISTPTVNINASNNQKQSNSVDRKQYYIPISERLMMNKNQSFVFVGQAAYTRRSFKLDGVENKHLNDLLKKNWKSKTNNN